MAKSYWLMKSEPDVYGWDKLVEDGSGTWDGVRNHQAKANMAAMKKGDEVLFYHSNIGLECVGLMTVVETAFPDPTDETGKWIAVKVEPLKPLAHPVSLKAMKANPDLAGLIILKHTRLSVAPVSAENFKTIMAMSKKPPAGA